LWPLWADLRGGDGIAVEGSYFARFTGPLAAVALALMCLVPVAVAARGRRALGAAGAVTGAAAGVGGLVAFAVLVAVAPVLDPPRAALGAAAGACASTAIVGAVRAVRGGAMLGGHLAHAAVGLLALGIAGTATGGNRLVSLRPGESATVLGHEVAYDGVTVIDGPVAGSEAVVADVTTGGQRLRPSLVAYPDRGVVLAESSLRSTPTVDVQVTLRTARDDGTALLQVGVHPLQVLVWWGGLAMVAAGAFATWEASRRRSDVPPASPRDGAKVLRQPA
jgi:cytochrome c biogenesis factor